MKKRFSGKNLWILGLCCLLLMNGTALAQEAEFGLDIEQVCLDNVIVYVGEVQGFTEGLGLVRYTELMEGFWAQIVDNQNTAAETPVRSLEESGGQFANVAFYVVPGGGKDTLVPMEFLLVRLEDIKALGDTFSREQAQEIALASLIIEPIEPDYATAMEVLPDARELYPEIDDLAQRDLTK